MGDHDEEINRLYIGFHVQTDFYEALKKLTENLKETNDQAFQVLLKNVETISKNTELNELAKDYCSNYSHTLQFCGANQNLQTRHEGQSKLLAMLANMRAPIRYKMTLEELKRFKDVNSLIVEELSSKLKSLYERESKMKTKLKHYNEILSKKYKSLSTWREKATAICIGTCAVVIVSSIVVAAAIVVPPVAVALCVASTIPIGSVGKGITKGCKKYESRIKDHQKVSYAMEEMTGFVIRDLKTIQGLIKNLKECEEKKRSKE